MSLGVSITFNADLNKFKENMETNLNEHARRNLSNETLNTANKKCVSTDIVMIDWVSWSLWFELRYPLGGNRKLADTRPIWWDSISYDGQMNTN